MVINITAELRAIEAALADRITIVHHIVDPSGTVVAKIAKTVLLRGDNKPLQPRR